MNIEKIAKYFNVSVEEATKRTIVQHETHTEVVCFIQDNGGTLKPIEVITDNGISACCYDKTDEDKKALEKFRKAPILH